jgi:hypothetical protein
MCCGCLLGASAMTLLRFMGLVERADVNAAGSRTNDSVLNYCAWTGLADSFGACLCAARPDLKVDVTTKDNQGDWPLLQVIERFDRDHKP